MNKADLKIACKADEDQRAKRNYEVNKMLVFNRWNATCDVSKQSVWLISSTSEWSVMEIQRKKALINEAPLVRYEVNKQTVC